MSGPAPVPVPIPMAGPGAPQPQGGPADPRAARRGRHRHVPQLRLVDHRSLDDIGVYPAFEQILGHIERGKPGLLDQVLRIASLTDELSRERPRTITM